MGAQLRVYKQKISSAQTTKKITKAMELIAASRIQKAMARVRASEPFSRAVTRAVSAVATGALLLAGCGSAGGGDDDEGTGSGEAAAEELADTITVGIEQTPDAYNANTADANAANTNAANKK